MRDSHLISTACQRSPECRAGVILPTGRTEMKGVTYAYFALWAQRKPMNALRVVSGSLPVRLADIK